MKSQSKSAKRQTRSMAVARLLVAVVAAASGLVLLAAVVPPLVEAVRKGDTAMLRTLLEQGVDANTSEADGTTALIWASYGDDADSTSLLLDAGADVNAANDLGATALWAASQNGSDEMVGLLLDAGADPDRALLLGETPLMVAARSGYPTVVERLITSGADVNRGAARRQTALMWAAAQKHASVVEVLLEHGADVHARSEVWRQVMAVPPHSIDEYNREIPHGGDTPLMFAARSGDLASARLLVAAGADVNAADAWGVSATSLAAHSGFGSLVEFLLQEGADTDPPGPGFTALHNAIMRNDASMVRALLYHGADANVPLTTWTPTRRSSRDLNYAPELVGATPFWLAARFSTPAVMRLLLDHGAEPLVVHEGTYYAISITDAIVERRHVTTALMAALGMGGGRAWVQLDRSEREARALEAAKLAVELGIDLRVASADGRTALDAARGMESVVEFLAGHGAPSGDDSP